MINQPFVSHESEDMPRRKVDGGPMLTVKPILNWIASQPPSLNQDQDGREHIKKQLYRAEKDNNGEIGFHAADRICCKLKAPMYQVYGDLYWEIEGI